VREEGVMGGRQKTTLLEMFEEKKSKTEKKAKK